MLQVVNQFMHQRNKTVERNQINSSITMNIESLPNLKNLNSTATKPFNSENQTKKNKKYQNLN